MHFTLKNLNLELYKFLLVSIKSFEIKKIRAELLSLEFPVQSNVILRNPKLFGISKTVK